LGESLEGRGKGRSEEGLTRSVSHSLAPCIYILSTRLCIARAIATEPEVLLLDEPCSALDPVATRSIEELMKQLKARFTIAIVTHNLQQAERVSDKTGFLYVDTSEGSQTGYLVEFGDSNQILHDPKEKETQQYIKRDQLIWEHMGA